MSFNKDVIMETPESSSRKLENDPDGISDDEADNLVPQIQKELDKLNQASTEINRLENELDEARSKYRSIITETSAKMEAISHDMKKSIHRAREYYKLKEEAKVAQGEALKAARQFQSATGVYKAAKETVALAECRLIEETDTPTAQLSSAWQEMLSHAITKVNEAEREKAKSEQEHKKKAGRYAELEGRIQFLEQKYGKSIKKSKIYFDLKAELDIKLLQQKHNVMDLQTAIKVNKMKYSESFRTLEAISEAIHISRSNKIWSMFPRMPGVGSDTFSVSSGLSDLGLELPGSTTDEFNSTKSDADSDTSDKDGNDGSFGITIQSRTVNFSMEKNRAAKNNSDSLATAEVNTDISHDSHAIQDKDSKKNLATKGSVGVINENKSDSNAEQNSDGRTVRKKHTETDSSETNVEKLPVAEKVGNEGHQINHSPVHKIKDSSVDETSDDVNEENFESCDEGDEFNNQQSENANNATSKSSDSNKIALNQSTKNEAEKKVEIEGTGSNKQSDGQVIPSSSTDSIGNQMVDENMQTDGEEDKSKDNVSDTGDVDQIDMRNVERPSISGAED